MRQILIGAQVAASCVLLIVAGLLVRALDRVSLSTTRASIRTGDRDQSGPGVHGYSPGALRPTWTRSEPPARAAWRGVGCATSHAAARRQEDGLHAQSATDARWTSMSITSTRPSSRRWRFRCCAAGTWPRGEHALHRRQRVAGAVAWPGEDPLGQQFDGNTVVGVAATPVRWRSRIRMRSRYITRSAGGFSIADGRS